MPWTVCCIYINQSKKLLIIEHACTAAYTVEGDVISECDLVTEGIVGSTCLHSATFTRRGCWEISVWTGDFIIE